MVTYADLFQFCILIVGICGLIYQIRKLSTPFQKYKFKLYGSVGQISPKWQNDTQLLTIYHSIVAK